MILFAGSAAKVGTGGLCGAPVRVNCDEIREALDSFEEGEDGK